jgi:glycosyltransferase
MKKRNPKISIITVVKNGMPYLMDSINSFLKQKYNNKELIIIYSKSSDLTLDYLNKIKNKNKNKNIRIIIDKYSKNKFGSLNLGIKEAKGDIFGLLHSDDIFYSNEVIKNIAETYQKNSFEIFYGNILFSTRDNLFSIKRSWQSGIFKPYKLYFGWMPPHTTVFLSKNIFKNFYYLTDLKISADYDYILRIFQNAKKIFYSNKIITIMRAGGDSSSNILTKIFEDFAVLKNFFYLYFVPFIMFFKYIRKLNQFFYSYKLKSNNYINSFIKKNYVRIVKTISNKIFKKNFIIIGINLACLSFILIRLKNMINNKYTYFWPDGIFSRIFINSKIIPGRNFVDGIKNCESFNSIYLIGSTNKMKLDYLKKKFVNKPVLSIDVPHANMDNIINCVKTVKFKKKSLIFLNLPTPKQELLAFFIAQNNKYFKIVCSGGAIDYNSGLHVKPPEILNRLYLESLWRLRNDFFRRILRLFYTFFIFVKNFLFKNYDQYTFKKI